MYQIDNTKRYNVEVVGGYSYKYKNAELIAIDRDFVVLKDSQGKEHIFTGVDIYIHEV